MNTNMNKFCTYLTIHKETGKYYIGKSTVLFVMMGYFGSGCKLVRTMKKYPKEQWKTEILSVFNTEDEAYANEAQLVNEECLADPLCMNLKLGGLGGSFFSAESKLFKNSQQKEAMKSVIIRKKISSGRIGKRMLPQIKIKCPHCGTVGGISGMNRYHFNNCSTNKRVMKQSNKLMGP